VWYDCLELQTTEALATYTEGPMKGLAAVARRKVGKGQVVLLGTLPTPEDLQRLLLSLGKDAGVLPVAEASPNLLVVPREGEAGQGLIVVELENAPATLTLPRAATDLLTGTRYSGKIDVKPYGVMVLKY
jgi:beta-galactosidase GanA